MGEQCITVVNAIDLSAAFDTVDHNFLLVVLEKIIEVTHTALKWFDSYLGPRNLKVKVGSLHSTERLEDFSVPQGSVSGPSLLLCLCQHYARSSNTNYCNT